MLYTLGGCLYIPDIFKFAQGESAELPAKQLASVKEYGRKEFAKFFKYICSLTHIKALTDSDDQIRFLPVLAPSVHSRFEEVVVEVIWQNLGNSRQSWFPPVDAAYLHRDMLTEFRIDARSTEIDDMCEFVYVCRAIFNEKSAFASMYVNETLFEKLSRDMSIVIGVAIALCGSEAIVASYYSVVKTKSMYGEQSNDTLVQRANIDWCFPMPT